MKIITLITDFGDSFYPGVMKGVIALISPEAKVIDIDHNIPFGDKVKAAYAIFCAFRYFPLGSIHIVVVDPEVGSERRAVMVEAEGHIFVAPDNGVLSLILERFSYKAFAFCEEIFALSPFSHTFHARDVFAPIGAWLARGVSLFTLGFPVEELVRIEIPKPKLKDKTIHAEVMLVDRFGNLITNVSEEFLKKFKIEKIQIKNEVILSLSLSYLEDKEKKIGAIINSCGLLEIFSPLKSASFILNAKEGEKVTITLKDA